MKYYLQIQTGRPNRGGTATYNDSIGAVVFGECETVGYDAETSQMTGAVWVTMLNCCNIFIRNEYCDHYFWILFMLSIRQS